MRKIIYTNIVYIAKIILNLTHWMHITNWRAEHKWGKVASASQIVFVQSAITLVTTNMYTNAMIYRLLGILMLIRAKLSLP